MDPAKAYVMGLLHDIGRRVGVTGMRHGIAAYSAEKWKICFAIKKRFASLCGCDIYTLLPNIYENSIADLI